MSSTKSGLEISFDLPLSLPGEDASFDAIQQETLQLFDECAPGLRRYVRSYGLSAAAVDDVVQDAFLALFRHLCLGRSRENLRGWLVRVSHRLALKQRARLARQQQREQPLAPFSGDAAVDPGPTPEARLAAERHRRRLRSVLHALPPRDRQCVLLRAEGLRYRDIARVLEISLGAVAKSLARAVSRLSNAGKE